ncbi:MAG: MFS transporter [gamma proteobacterium endosymbiont of Trioza apicalis]
MKKLFLSKRDFILFPLSLVLFEFTVYVANDMIQPVMLTVVMCFNTDINWIPTSLTSYLAGGVFVQWLFGPLSDIQGRRPIMLFGVFFFSLSCFSILFVSNIEQFIIMRFIQGIGLCFIGSVGYAVIQEIFNETQCIKIISLMANVALIAPLFGPLAGAILVDIISWKGMFIIFSLLSLISFVGLYFFMPETVIVKNKKPLSFFILWCNYKKVLRNLCFIFGSLSIGFANLPLLSWIALSPIILINGEHLSIFIYAMLQIPVFGGLLLGNFTLSYLTTKKTLVDLIKFGGKPMILGLIITSISVIYLSNIYIFIIIGLSLYAFGLGVSNACLTRLTLFSSNLSKGIVSAAMGIIIIIVFILGIEFSKKMYLFGEENAFNLLNLFSGLCWLFFIKYFLKNLINKK